MYARPSAASPRYAKNATPGAQRRLSEESLSITAPCAASWRKTSTSRALLHFVRFARRNERCVVRHVEEPQRAVHHLREDRRGDCAAVVLPGGGLVDHHRDHEARRARRRKPDEGGQVLVGSVAAV